VSQDHEKDQILDHEYDGIREYDNRLPNWWLYTLYGSIVFGVCYWFFFHTIGAGQLPPERYQTSVAEAAKAQLAGMGDQELTNESLGLMATIPDQVSQGRRVFDQFCVVCHGQSGEGVVGPNLTDGVWLHGAKPLDIYNTVTNGVPEKGMVAWGNQLGPARVSSVVAYVLSIKNTNVPGKEPQGEPETASDGESE